MKNNLETADRRYDAEPIYVIPLRKVLYSTSQRPGLEQNFNLRNCPQLQAIALKEMVANPSQMINHEPR